MTKSSPDVSERDDLPEHDLEWYFDDDETPEEVTIFNPDSGSLVTTWITVDVDTAVGLDRIR